MLRILTPLEAPSDSHSLPVCLSTSHDHIVPQQHAGHQGREDRDELQSPWREAHHGALGEGGGEREAVAHHQPGHVEAYCHSQESRRGGHLYSGGIAVSSACLPYIIL